MTEQILNHFHFSPTKSDQSSGFDENVNDCEPNSEVESSTPFGKENDRNACNRNRNSSCGSHQFNGLKLTDQENYKAPNESTDTEPPVITAKKAVHFRSDFESTKVSTAPLQPRSLTFSPIEALKHTQKSMPQTFDNFFATPSIKPPLTTGRVIFSSSQHKLRPPRKLDSDSQKTLFQTPQSIASRQTSSNTSDYVTDSFNSIKKTLMVSVLSPIDEEKISIDDFHVLSAKDDGTALTNKVLEINGKDFILKKKIGCGGSCIVYSGKCKAKAADCALKVVNLRTDASNVETYLNETKLLESLQGNDSVIKLFG